VQGVISLAGVVPETAHEVKLFLDIATGHYAEDKGATLMTFTTDQDKAKARVYPYPQNAWTVNSSNFSLYLGQKVINVTYEGNQAFTVGQNGGHGYVKLTVLGYR